MPLAAQWDGQHDLKSKMRGSAACTEWSTIASYGEAGGAPSNAEAQAAAPQLLVVYADGTINPPNLCVRLR